MNGTGGGGIDVAMLTMPESPVTARHHPVTWNSCRDLEDPARAKALVNWKHNPAASSPEQGAS